MISEKQTVKIRRDRMQIYPAATGRLLDGRKGRVLEVYVPLGAKEAVVKVRWFARRPSETDVTMEHPMSDLEVIPNP
ncbi:hypothetical protein ABHF33_00365 [Chitinibacter sp. FCG-7]|uniref:Uncharacterized protein n=1 Tax=Chitinibacter mangrovi TaxID=3153927 RepID=A0AAU7F9C8_9NEIS|nr:hypothetical protein [Chitinibacter sp. GC72]